MTTKTVRIGPLRSPSFLQRSRSRLFLTAVTDQQETFGLDYDKHVHLRSTTNEPSNDSAAHHTGRRGVDTLSGSPDASRSRAAGL